MKPEISQQATRTTNGAQDWTYASVASDQTLQLFFGTEALANNTTTANGKLFLGATDLTNNLVVNLATGDAVAAASAFSTTTGSSTKCLERNVSSGTVSLSAAVSAALSNGTRITYGVTDGVAYLFNGLSLAGTDHVCHISTAQFSTTDTNKVVTHGDSAAPDGVILIITVGSTGTDVPSFPQKTIYAFWDGTTSVSVSELVSTQTNPILLAARANNDLGHQFDNFGTDVATLSIGSVGPTTFTLTRTATGGIPLFVQCISIRHTSGTWAGKCGIATTPTSPSTVALTTGMAAQPQVLFTIATRLTSTALAANSDAAGSLSFGVSCDNAGTTQQMAVAQTNKNAVATSVNKCYTSNNAALLSLDNTGAVVNKATAVWNSDGVSLNHSAVGASAFEFIYFTFGISSGINSAATASASASAALTTAIRAAGAATAGTSASAGLTNWASVVLAGTQYTGTGGLHDPALIAQGWDPPVGATILYDGTNVTCYSNGEISSIVNNCSFVAQYNDGITWRVAVILITSQMVSAAVAGAAASGALTTAIQFAAGALAIASATGQVATAILMAGAAASIANAAAVLITGVQLNAAAVSGTSATGALTGGEGSLQGTATALSTALGALSAQIQFAGAVVATSVMAGALAAKIQFAGAAAALSSASADIQVAIRLAGDAVVGTSAAASALITSSLSSAAHAVSTATGALFTALQFAGSAFVSSSAQADLSTGISLSGAAEVDTQAAITPTGAEGQFGRADINVLSPTGFPTALAVFIEGSTAIVTIAYFNTKGLPFVPNRVQWTLTDMSSGIVLVPYTDIVPVELSNAVTIPGNKNGMVNKTRASEQHEILFQVTDNANQISYARAIFEIISLNNGFN